MSCWGFLLDTGMAVLAGLLIAQSQSSDALSCGCLEGCVLEPTKRMKWSWVVGPMVLGDVEWGGF